MKTPRQSVLAFGLLLGAVAAGSWVGSQAVAALPAAAKANVVVILDASGSMTEPMADGRTRKMDAAKEALRAVLAKTPQDVQIGLFVFGAKNINDGIVGGTTYGWAYPLGTRNDSRLTRAIGSPIPGYKTPLGSCIQMGASALLQERTREQGAGVYRLLIVTDGQADDPDVMEQTFSQAVANGIIVDVVGVLMKETHLLAARAHRYYSADDPKALMLAVAQVFAETRSSGSGKAQFDVITTVPDEVAMAMLQALAVRCRENSQK